MTGQVGTRPAQPGAGRRSPFLPAAVLGNGSLLVTVSARGEIERLFRPHVDGPAARELRLAFAMTGDEARPLDEVPFSWEQRYEPDAMILGTIVRAGQLELEAHADLVNPDEPVLARRLRATRRGRGNSRHLLPPAPRR